MICKIIINLLCSIIFFYLIDFIIFIIGDNNKNRRWYLVHAIANTFVVYYGINNLVECFKDPFLIMKEKYSKNTFLLDFVVALHLYHIINSYKNLRLIDWIHHLVSCILVGYSSLLVCNEKMINYILFFICGLPGGIDYYLLSLEKYNIINKLFEKKINIYLHMCIRLPGILFGAFIVYLNLIYNPYKNYNYCENIILLLIMILNCINAIYFSIDVCVNYGYKLKLLEDILINF
jgi:hypothetical protein